MEKEKRGNKKIVTVLTATYNRGYILSKLYKSLKQQTSMNFEWMIVDDGSKDNSRELVDAWMKNDNGFNIYYFYKENGGKHRAINFAIEKINTPYIFLVDSDDQLLEMAIQRVEEWIETIKNEKFFAGVSGLRGYTKDRQIGDFPNINIEKNYIDTTNIQRRKFKLLGDKAEVYKTELLKKHPFPVFENETFISESLVWNKIALEGYKIRWFNEIIYLTDYLEDGLSKNLDLLHWNNFKGYTMEVKQNFSVESRVYKYLILGKYCSIARKKGMGGEWIRSHLHITRWQYCIGKQLSLLYLIKSRWKIRIAEENYV